MRFSGEVTDTEDDAGRMFRSFSVFNPIRALSNEKVREFCELSNQTAQQKKVSILTSKAQANITLRRKRVQKGTRLRRKEGAYDVKEAYLVYLHSLQFRAVAKPRLLQEPLIIAGIIDVSYQVVIAI